MRGELVPEASRWSGNPIGPWREVKTGRYLPEEPATTTTAADASPTTAAPATAGRR
jgi:hypothetical protein